MYELPLHFTHSTYIIKSTQLLDTSAQDEVGAIAWDLRYPNLV